MIVGLNFEVNVTFVHDSPSPKTAQITIIRTSSEIAIAVAAMAAVSARKIVEPSEAEIHPALLKKLQFVFRPTALGTDRQQNVAFRVESENIAQQALLFRLCEDNPQARRLRLTAVLQFDGSDDFGRGGAAGLLGSLERDSAPAFDAFRRCRQPDARRYGGRSQAQFGILPVPCISRSPIPCGRI